MAEGLQRTAHHEPSEDNLEKLKQWQEARLQRKLHGEYESAAFNLAELVSSAEFVRMLLNLRTNLHRSTKISRHRSRSLQSG